MNSKARKRFYVGPAWPPHVSAYEYARTLPRTGWGWEFLRRNPVYQRDYKLCRAGCPSFCWHKTGIALCRLRRRSCRAEAWGLCSFRRSSKACPSMSRILVS
ncbi:transcriptional regulator domain-containing protein [Hyphomicrobium sp. DMF-1]|uniref:transcriptional regulator domain-containing protein n=1 Tax=Hyphomicrobium sp. DMF-1 TaxID=3019544 RepID=UPI003FA5A1A8